MEHVEGAEFKELLYFLAHDKDWENYNPDAPSLGIQTDVWNITTRPASNTGVIHLATAAEDFTSKVFEINLENLSFKELT